MPLLSSERLMSKVNLYFIVLFVLTMLKYGVQLMLSVINDAGV